MAAPQQQKLAGAIGSKVAKSFIRRQWWKLLVEAVPIAGDVMPTFLWIVISELTSREKQGEGGVMSTEGVMMITLAGIVDGAGYVCLALDAALGIGFIISPAVAITGYGMIGIWQAFSSGD